MRTTVALPFALVALGFVALACADEALVTLPPPPEEPVEEAPPAAVEDEEEPALAPPPPEDSGAECDSDDDCGSATECASGVCVGVGVLQITLAFDANTDADLHVITPSGEEIDYSNPAAAGGVLDVDTCISEFDCTDGTNVENIFFNGAMEPGIYIAYAINFDGRDGGPFRIDVSGAANLFLEGTLLAEGGEATQDLTFAIE